MIVITGASAGIGRALAELFTGKGHALLLVARKMPPLDFPRTHCVSADVADYDTLKRAIDDAEAEFGPVDCMINNAGVADCRPFDQVDPNDFEREIRTNLIGAMNGAKAVFDGMVGRKRGTIINVSSISDRKTVSVAVGYTASKFGMRSMSESLREAGAPHGVRVINLAPAFIRTNIHAGMGITFDEYKKLVGDPDFMTAEEFAEIVRYCYEAPAHLCIRDLVVTPTRSTM